MCTVDYVVCGFTQFMCKCCVNVTTFLHAVFESAAKIHYCIKKFHGRNICFYWSKHSLCSKLETDARRKKKKEEY